jgi:hypothetical protein
MRQMCLPSTKNKLIVHEMKADGNQRLSTDGFRPRTANLGYTIMFNASNVDHRPPRSILDTIKAPQRASAGSKTCYIRNLPSPYSLEASRPANLIPSSPSTSTHHPSPPLPPFPPIAALKFAFAYSRISASKLPGCSHTAGIPTSAASLSNCFVTAGGVMTERE